MGYQRSAFPHSVYGCINTASHKVIWTYCTDKCDPKRIARWYFDYLFDKRIETARLRIDKGSETGDIATMHTFLIVTWKILPKVLYLENLQQIRSKNGGVSYMIVLKKLQRATYESTGTRSLWPTKRNTLKYYSICLHFSFRKRNAFICHKLE